MEYSPTLLKEIPLTKGGQGKNLELKGGLNKEGAEIQHVIPTFTHKKELSRRSDSLQINPGSQGTPEYRVHRSFRRGEEYNGWKYPLHHKHGGQADHHRELRA